MAKDSFRVTEQGETIASRYGHHDLAHRHLERMQSQFNLILNRRFLSGRCGPGA